MIRKIICFLRKFLFLSVHLPLLPQPPLLPPIPQSVPIATPVKHVGHGRKDIDHRELSSQHSLLHLGLMGGQWPMAIGHPSPPIHRVPIPVFSNHSSPRPLVFMDPGSCEYTPNSPQVEEIVPFFKIQDRTFRATRDFFLTGGHF